MALSVCRAASSPKMIAPSAARSSEPSAAITLGTELLGDAGERGSAGFDDLAGDLVGIHDHGTVLAEAAGDGRLAGGDSSREGDEHRPILSGPRASRTPDVRRRRGEFDEAVGMKDGAAHGGGVDSQIRNTALRRDSGPGGDHRTVDAASAEGGMRRTAPETRRSGRPGGRSPNPPTRSVRPPQPPGCGGRRPEQCVQPLQLGDDPVVVGIPHLAEQFGDLRGLVDGCLTEVHLVEAVRTPPWCWRRP